MARQPTGHVRNLYRHFKPDFDFLAELYPEFRGEVVRDPRPRKRPPRSRIWIDWTEPEVVRAVTRVLLQHDFGLLLELPLANLCPPVERCLNYLHWISDLLATPSGNQDIPRCIDRWVPNWPPEKGELCWARTPTEGSASPGGDESASPWAQARVLEHLEEDRFRLEFLYPGGGDTAVRRLSELRPVAPTSRRRSSSLPLSESSSPEEKERERSVTGIDIGTGASCIFPLLGTRCYEDWNFLATEVNPESVESARRNVTLNGLEDRIQVVTAPDPSRIFMDVLPAPQPSQDSASAGWQFQFSMCNPPFFSSLEQTGLNRKRKTMATNQELVCPGGEQQFVLQMIRESFKFATSIRWFTSMLGRKTSFIALGRVLQTEGYRMGVAAVRQTEFVQGRQTRWGLAWTFDPDLRESGQEGGGGSSPKRKLAWTPELLGDPSPLEWLRDTMEAWREYLRSSRQLEMEWKAAEDDPFALQIKAFPPIDATGDGSGFECSGSLLQLSASKFVAELRFQRGSLEVFWDAALWMRQQQQRKQKL